MKSVLCEMKYVLCEMEICTLRNENLYFAKRKSVLCEMKICNFMENFYFPTIMTVTHISQFCRGINYCVTEVYNERTCCSNTFFTLFSMSRVKLQKYQTSGEEF